MWNRKTRRLELPQNKTREIWTRFSPSSEPTFQNSGNFQRSRPKRRAPQPLSKEESVFLQLERFEKANPCKRLREKMDRNFHQFWVSIVKEWGCLQRCGQMDSISTCFYQGVQSLWSSFPNRFLYIHDSKSQLLAKKGTEFPDVLTTNSRNPISFKIGGRRQTVFPQLWLKPLSPKVDKSNWCLSPEFKRSNCLKTFFGHLAGLDG